MNRKEETINIILTKKEMRLIIDSIEQTYLSQGQNIETALYIQDLIAKLKRETAK